MRLLVDEHGLEWDRAGRSRSQMKINKNDTFENEKHEPNPVEQSETLSYN